MFDYTVIGPAGAEGRRGGADDLRSAAEATGGDGFVWVEFDDPEHRVLAAALEALGFDRLGLAPEHASHRRPKVEVVEGAVMVLVKTVWYIEGTRQVETGDLTFFTDGRSLVTVRRGVVDPVPAVRRRLGAEPEFRSEGVAGVAHALFDAIVEQYDGAVEDLTDDVSDLERAVFSGQRVTATRRSTSSSARPSSSRTRCGRWCPSPASSRSSAKLRKPCGIRVSVRSPGIFCASRPRSRPA